MFIRENVSLKKFNTFGIDAHTRYYTRLEDISQLQIPVIAGLIREVPFLLLGGGSNVLFVNNFDGLTLHIKLRGITVEKETSSHVYVKALAGEDWENLVDYCVKNDWGGLENLTLIPGNVGTSPMQNIGAYGVELRDQFYCLEACEITTGKIHTFFAGDCSFGYRDSFFKREGKGRFIILSVTFRLTKNNHLLHTHYGSVKEQLEIMEIKVPTIADVRAAVQQIRRSKLPDAEILGNAGSFFKNPMIDSDQFQKLQSAHPDIPNYADPSGKVKVAAAWLIERAGWKGYREGDAGVHSKQALVLVNYGKAEGKQLFRLAQNIQEAVFNMFGVKLEPEVNLVGAME